MSYYPSPRPDPIMLLAGLFIGAGATLVGYLALIIKLLEVTGG